jgi:hypothetical protein
MALGASRLGSAAGDDGLAAGLLCRAAGMALGAGLLGRAARMAVVAGRLGRAAVDGDWRRSHRCCGGARKSCCGAGRKRAQVRERARVSAEAWLPLRYREVAAR